MYLNAMEGSKTNYSFAIIGFIIFMLMASLLFWGVEKWTYADALYYTFITLTTIGFGDFVPGNL